VANCNWNIAKPNWRRGLGRGSTPPQKILGGNFSLEMARFGINSLYFNRNVKSNAMALLIVKYV